MLEPLEFDYIFKMVLIGDAGVGKSSLLYRFTDDKFSSTYISTIGLDFRIKNVQVNDHVVKLHLWDTAGHERFKAITNSYYRGAQGIIMVYDSTCKKSFENITHWLSDVKRNTDSRPIIYLLANKSDLKSRRGVDPKEMQSFADTHGMKCFETSAKHGTLVMEAFKEIAADVVATMSPRPAKSPLNTASLRLDAKTNNSGYTCCGIPCKIFTQV